MTHDSSSALLNLKVLLDIIFVKIADRLDVNCETILIPEE